MCLNIVVVALLDICKNLNYYQVLLDCRLDLKLDQSYVGKENFEILHSKPEDQGSVLLTQKDLFGL